MQMVNQAKSEAKGKKLTETRVTRQRKAII